MSDSSETTRSTNVAPSPSSQVPSNALRPNALPVASRGESVAFDTAETARTTRDPSPLSSQEVVEQLTSSPSLASKCVILAAPEFVSQDQIEASHGWVESETFDRRSAGPARPTPKRRMRMEAISELAPSTAPDSGQKVTSNKGEADRIDQETKSAILRQLRQKLNRCARHVSCHVASGHVTLNGTVRSFYEMQLAQEAALRTRGVKSVINRIEVESSDFRD